MDKLYKSHFLKHVKHAMATQFPGFAPHVVPRDHPLREIFVGSLLYRAPTSGAVTAWIRWEPGPGVERCFHIYLGWSPGPDILPQHHTHDARLYGLRGPDPIVEAASLDLEQIEGKAAIGGITIPSPWDELLTVKATAPRRVQQDAQRKAYAAALALSDTERAAAVERTIEDVCARVWSQLPAFVERLGALGEGA